MKAVLIPVAPQLRPYSALVERTRDLCKRNVFKNAVINLSDNSSFISGDGILPILALNIAEREHSVHLALCSIIHHPALDVLAHVFGIELVDIHHRPQRKATCGGVAKFLFGI